MEGRLLGRSSSQVYMAWPYDCATDDDMEQDECGGEDQEPPRVVVLGNESISEIKYSTGELTGHDAGEPEPTPARAPGSSDGDGGGDGWLAGWPHAWLGDWLGDWLDDWLNDCCGDGNGGPGEGRPPEKPEDAGNPKVVGMAQAMIGKRTVQFQVLDLVRAPGFLTLDARVVNVRGGRWTVGDALSEDGTNSLAGLEVFDPEGKSTYPAGTKGGGDCACTSGLDEVTLEQGEFRNVTAIFKAPPSGTDSVTLIVPSFGAIHDVDID